MRNLPAIIIKRKTGNNPEKIHQMGNIFVRFLIAFTLNFSNFPRSTLIFYHNIKNKTTVEKNSMNPQPPKTDSVTALNLKRRRIGLTFATNALLLLLAFIPLTDQTTRAGVPLSVIEFFVDKKPSVTRRKSLSPLHSKTSPPAPLSATRDTLRPDRSGSLKTYKGPRGDSGEGRKRAGRISPLLVEPAPIHRREAGRGQESTDLTENSACSSSCATSNTASPILPDTEIESLLARFATEPMASGSEALETLLFHGAQVQEFLIGRQTSPLDPERRRFLQAELSRTHAIISVRLVDEHGVERLSLEPRRIPLDIKQHLVADQATRIQPAEISGTVKRVGLHHLWARI
jgi:hypothetical protein